MSKESIEIVRRANAAFLRGDMEAVEDLYSPQIEWRDLQHAPDAPEVVHGIDAVKRIWSDWQQAFGDLRMNISEYLELGDVVVCAVHWQATGRESGVLLDLHAFDGFEVKDGKIVRATFGYSSKEEALAASVDSK